MTALILFTRELARELRSRADECEGGGQYGADFLMRQIAASIEVAAKKAFHL
jgi:hypothetical protein